MAVVVAAAHVETVLGVVAGAEADIGKNRDSSGGVDCDGSGNVGFGGGDGNSRR